MEYFDKYIDYAKCAPECPPLFHRWSAVSLLAAYLGRQVNMPFGQGCIYPNLYVMFMGDAGSRKSSAITLATKLLRQTGYDRFSADRTSKERFLMDMKCTDAPLLSATLSTVELEELIFDEPHESLIAADEFTDFLGPNNVEFVTMLTTLWDNRDSYINPKIHGKSVEVIKPTVNILAGNTLQNFTLAFPPEALGNGFLSRTILVHGDATGVKVTFPPPPNKNTVAWLIDRIKESKKTMAGEVILTEEAMGIADRLYREFKPLADSRFAGYGNRRFTNLLKVAMVMAVADLRREVTALDLINANTMLAYTERKMPRALGEFGRSKLSGLSNSIMAILHKASKPVSPNELFVALHHDINKASELSDVLSSLEHAGKIKYREIGGKQGLVANVEVAHSWAADLINDDFLTMEERN